MYTQLFELEEAEASKASTVHGEHHLSRSVCTPATKDRTDHRTGSSVYEEGCGFSGHVKLIMFQRNTGIHCN